MTYENFQQLIKDVANEHTIDWMSRAIVGGLTSAELNLLKESIARYEV